MAQSVTTPVYLWDSELYRSVPAALRAVVFRKMPIDVAEVQPDSEI
jgi:hypothetical protein